jgi:hypothetical protein
MIVIKNTASFQIIKFIMRSLYSSSTNQGDVNYNLFKRRVVNASGVFEGSTCLTNFFSNVSYTIKIRSKAQNKVISTLIGANLITTNSYYNQIRAVFTSDLVEDEFYTLEITETETGAIVYRDLMFCTNQEIPDYSINKDVYTTNVTENEFKYYENE